MAPMFRRLGLVVALVTGGALVLPASVGALPNGTAKTGMVCTPGTVSGSTHTFNLVADTGYVDTPDGNSLFMWSYAVAPPDDANGAAGSWPDFQSPGPVLCVTQGQTVVINLSNSLPETTSIVFPGQDAAVTASGGAVDGLLVREAAARVGSTNGTVSYTFTAGSPGTYIYQSGSNVTKQVEMGLYGAIVVRPAGHADWAYNAASQFDPGREFILILGELDPVLHHAVETNTAYDFTTLHDRYYTINGRSFPDTIQDNGTAALPNQPYGALVRIQPNDATRNLPALIRMLNVGTSNHPFHPHGNHTREIAQDGRLLLANPSDPTSSRASTEHFGETIGSGQTLDFLIRWDNQALDSSGQAFNDDWNPNSNQLPVAQPNYRNLTFKDGVTWYAGSPYLGYKGTLPTGTTSLNICGEWYFPFHSHALNEFSNFDEGFGGMGTLLRVDPLGGCFSFPTSTKILIGALGGGTVANLAADDANYYQVKSTTNGNARTSDWYAQFSGVQAGSTNFALSYKGRNCGTGSGCPATAAKPTTLFAWNWGASSWVSIAGPASVGGPSDVTITAATIASPGAYLGTGANKGLVRIRVLTQGTNSSFVTGGNVMKLVYDAP